MRNLLRALALFGLSIFFLTNPFGGRSLLAVLANNREYIAFGIIACFAFVALCIMAVSLGAARAGLPIGEIIHAIKAR